METINLTFGTKPFEASRDVGFSENSLSIGDFWEANKGRLPMLIRVQEGFMGAHWFDEISTGQVNLFVFFLQEETVLKKNYFMKTEMTQDFKK